MGGLRIALIDFMIFSSPFLDDTRMTMSSFFPRTAILWNSLLIECFSLSYVQKDLKSRIHKYLLTVRSLSTDFLHALIFLCLFFLVTPCLVVAVQPCIE